MRVIKNNEIIEDSWQRIPAVADGETVPEEGDVIVPFSYWKEHRHSLEGRKGKTAVCLNGDDRVEEIAPDLQQFALIALDFPVFKDGRCYSHARLLRDRYAYPGEIRAVGDVLRDQLFFMKRCGIDAFQIREDKDPADALKAFTDFTVTYQPAADNAPPIYTRR